MNDEIEPIIPLPLPFSLDEKVFQDRDDEGNILGEPYSMNDALKFLENISGINEDLMGNDGKN